MALATGYEKAMLRGHVDQISPHLISGWAVDDVSPDRPVDVSVFLDGRKVAQVTCSAPREDLRDKAGFGDGRHGFRLEPKPPLPAARPVRVTIRHAGSGRLLGGGDVILPAGSSARPADLNADLPSECLVLPSPGRPREVMELLSLYDSRVGLFNLLSQVDFSDRTLAQIGYAALGAMAAASAQPQTWDRAQARDAMNNLLLSPEFQHNILRLFLDAFPEKRRLLFVHIPKCAGSDLSSHLVTRYPSIPERLRAPQWTGKDALLSELAELVRRLRYSDSVFVRGHINLAEYLEQGLVRPCDRVFTILREPVEIAISQVNYILTRVSADAKAGAFQPDSQEWFRLLELDPAPEDVSDAFLRELGEQALREQKIVRPNSMCHWLGGGDAQTVLARLEAHGVEVTTTREYSRWLRERWGVESKTRQNESVKFLTLDGLRPEELAYLRGVCEEDAMLYESMERGTLLTGACSVRRGANLFE